jgi:hypothetical protein
MDAARELKEQLGNLSGWGTAAACSSNIVNSMKQSTARLRRKLSPTFNDPPISNSTYFPVLLSTWQRLPSHMKKDFRSFERLQEAGTDVFGMTSSQYMFRLKGLMKRKKSELAEETESSTHSRLTSTRSYALFSRQASMRTIDLRQSLVPPSFKTVEIKYKELLKQSISPHSILVGSLDTSNHISTLKAYNIKAILTLGAEDTTITHSYIRGYLRVPCGEPSDLSKVVAAVERFMDLHLHRGSVIIAGIDPVMCTVVACCYLMRHFQETCAEVYKVAKHSIPSIRVPRRLYEEMKAMENAMKAVNK